MEIRAKYKTTIKRVICYIVAFAMIVGMAPVTAHAEEETYGYTIECCEGEGCNINMGHTVDGVTVNASPNVKYEYGTEDVNVFFQADEGATFSGIVIKEEGVEKKFIKAAEVDNGYAVVKSCSYTIPTTDFGKNITIKVVNWEHPFDNEYVVNYGTEDNASIADEGGHLEGGMMCTFEVGSPITFTFTPPESSEEAPYRVLFCKNMADPVDVASELVANGDGTYTWTYAAEDATGFVIDVIWTAAEASIRECWDYMSAKDEAGEEYIVVDYSYGNGGTVTVNENDKIAKQGYDNNYGMFIFEEEAVLELVVTPVDGGAINGIFINDEEVDLSNPELFDEATGTLKVAVDPSAEEPIWILIDFASNGYSAGYNESAFDISYNGNHINSWKEYEFPEGEDAITLDIKVMEEYATLYGIRVSSDKNGVYCIKPEDIADAETEGLYHFVIDNFDDFCQIELIDWEDSNLVYEGRYKVDYNLMYDSGDDARGVVNVGEELINSIRQSYDYPDIQYDYKYTEGEAIEFVMVPPAGIEGKPYKIAVRGFEQDYEDIDMNQVVAGEALEDGRIPYIFSYTPQDAFGFNLGIWWEEAQYDFDMCYSDGENQYEVYYWVNIGADVLSIEDGDEANNIVKQAKYREDGKLVLDGDAELKVTIAEEYRDKVAEIRISGEGIALDGSDDRYDPEEGIITWSNSQHGTTDLGVDFMVPGVYFDYDTVEMDTTMNGVEVSSWEEKSFPEGTVTLGFKPNDEYNLKGIRIRTADSPEYCVGFDEMEYDEESGQYLYVVPDTDIRYEISTVSQGDNGWTTKGEYVLYYEQSEDGYITLDGSDEAIESYIIYDYDSENTDSFDLIIHNPEWMAEAPYKVAYQINGYEQVEVDSQNIVPVENSEGLYKYTFDMGADAGKGFKLWVYWTEEQYNFDVVEPVEEQGKIQCFVTNGPVPNVTANDGEGNISEYASYNSNCKVIYDFNYNESLFDDEREDYYSLFQVQLEESATVESICLNNWDEVALDGTDERYNAETKVLTLKLYNGEYCDVNINYKASGYSIGFNSHAYTVSVNGENMSPDTDFEFGDANEYKFVFTPVDRGEDTATLYGIKLFTGEGEDQTISYISSEGLNDEGNGAYSYTVTNTQEKYRFEIIDWEGCVFDNQYKIGYDEAYNAIKIGNEDITPWENYSYADFTVNEDGTVTFAIDIYPQANEEGIESPFGIIVDVNDWSRTTYFCDEYEPSFVDNGDYYTFTYTMQDFLVGAGVTFMVCSTSDEFNYETCVPYMDEQYQLDYDANVDNVVNVIYSLNYSDTSEDAFFNHASYRDRGRIVLDREQELTFVITPEAGKDLKDIIVDGGSVMGTVTTNEDGYVFTIDVWNGNAPSIHFEFEDALGYKVQYNPYNIVATDVNHSVMETEVLHAYPEGEQEMTIRFLAEDGYDYENLFSGIKVVQRNPETGDETVTFVKKSELSVVCDEYTGDPVVGSYEYTITDFGVATEIMVVDWVYPFNNQYMIQFPQGYGASAKANDVDINPFEVYDCTKGEPITFTLNAPTDVEGGIYKVTVAYNEEEPQDYTEILDDMGDGTYIFGLTPSSDMGIVINVIWTEEQAIFEQMEPTDDTVMAGYNIFFDSYNGVEGTGSVTITEPEGTNNLVDQCKFRNEGKLILTTYDTALIASVTPDENCSFVGVDGIGENRVEPTELDYDEDTNTYTFEWNPMNGQPTFVFEANKSIDFAAIGTTDSVTVTGTTINVSEVNIEIPDIGYASTVTVNEDGTFEHTFDISGANVSDKSELTVTVTDSSFTELVETGNVKICNEHEYVDCEDEYCGFCEAKREAPGHSYANCEALECDNCDHVRDAGEHTYDDCLDTECNVCGTTREAEAHVYSDCTVAVCDKCGAGEREAAEDHVYTDCEDTTCDNAGCTVTREAPGHSTSGPCDEVCNECSGAITSSEDHSYTDCTDAICNVCSMVREAAEDHVYTDCTDASCDNEGCTVTREAAEDHVYTDCTDPSCNNDGCTVTREAEADHKYTDCTDPSCNNEGCTVTREAAEDHVYTDCTDASCDNEGCTVTREAAEDHVYTDCTDGSCNNEGCTVTREAAADHKYTDCTDASCDNEGCTVTRTAPGHTTDGLCDKKCNVCDANIDTIYEHTYSGCEDTDCDVCGETRTAGKHEYADCTAETCENCTFGDRTAPGHKYTDCVDTTCDNDGCTFERTDAPGHDVDGDCDEKCDVCNGKLDASAEHTYAGCEDTECDVCGNTRKALAHKYTDCDDTTCDNEGCDNTRTAVAHKYTDCADTTCNTCNKTRTAPGHAYEGQTWLKDASSHWQKCANCTATSTKEAHKMVEQEDGSSKCSVCGHIVECEEVPNVTVSYRTHIQSFGWEKEFKNDGEMSGTSGKAKRLEGIEIKVDSAETGKDVDLGIQYTTHCQSYGWLPWSADGDMNGTEGEAKRLEAIKIQLTGEDADEYDVYYRVHAQSYGWLGWASNGDAAGTAGLAKRLEGIQIVVVKKGESFNKEAEGIKSVDTRAYVAKDGSTDATVTGAATPNITYRTHVQSFGWQGWKYNGAMSGTSGLAKRLEGIEIKLSNKDVEGGIAYCTHVQTYAWQGADLKDPTTWKQNGQMAGTSGEAKRLEAICIQLTGEMAEKYDVYYRVHAQSYGWLSWASTGAPAGTAGYAKRLEGIQIVIVPKGEKPADNYQGVTSTNPKPYIEK